MATPLTDTSTAYVATVAGVAATMMLSSVVAIATLGEKHERETVDRYAGNAIYSFLLGMLANAFALIASIIDLFTGEMHLRNPILWASVWGITATAIGLTVTALLRLRTAGALSTRNIRSGLLSLGMFAVFVLLTIVIVGATTS